MKTYTEEQVLDILVSFNKEKGEYKSVSSSLIEKWLKWYIAFKGL
jgi:hypothetical protein